MVWRTVRFAASGRRPDPSYEQLKTDERIEVIVERTGFSEPSTFYRAFKRWVGETPVEFRKRGKT